MTYRAGPLLLPDEMSTAALAARLAPSLHAGDCLLLSGPIGAGKSTFARALIRALTGNPNEDVPSPTFTLVQTYPTKDTKIWHADLYRLTHPDEAAELGLEEAFDSSICLVEWPDRLGSLAPTAALRIDFLATPEGPHILSVEGDDPWRQRLESWLD